MNIDYEETLRKFEQNDQAEALRRIEQNDVTMKKLWIGNTTCRCGYSTITGGIFNSRVGSDYSRLGELIGENTHLRRLEVEFSDDEDDYDNGHEITLDVTHTAFFDGLKCNSSIHEMNLFCCQQNIGRGVPNEILKAYQANNNLTSLYIKNASLENEGEHVIATTLRRCTHLKEIGLYHCNINNEQLLPIVNAVRGHASLKDLDLHGIGNAGCSILDNLLEDPNSNLCTLVLTSNEIGYEGKTILANSLVNNTKLRKLYVGAIPQGAMHAFSGLLCNTSSINQTYLSNHTLENMSTPNGENVNRVWTHITSLLELNMGPNKSHVAIKKILKCHPNIDMEPFFEWNTEGEYERNLKALPYVIAWFEKAEEAVAEEDGESYNIEERKLSAIYQFAQAMPLLFVPASSCINGNGQDEPSNI